MVSPERLCTAEVAGSIGSADKPFFISSTHTDRGSCSRGRLESEPRQTTGDVLGTGGFPRDPGQYVAWEGRGGPFYFGSGRFILRRSSSNRGSLRKLSRRASVLK